MVVCSTRLGLRCFKFRSHPSPKFDGVMQHRQRQRDFTAPVLGATPVHQVIPFGFEIPIGVVIDKFDGERLGEFCHQLRSIVPISLSRD